MAFYGGPEGTTMRAVEPSTEGEAVQYRYMPPEAAMHTYRENREFYDELAESLPEELLPIKASVRLISGCQDNQLSRDGIFNGLFTGRLLRVWSGGRFTGDYHDFHKKILAWMPPNQSPNHYFIGTWNPIYDAQRPFTI
jgi:hypothetical protein